MWTTVTVRSTVRGCSSVIHSVKGAWNFWFMWVSGVECEGKRVVRQKSHEEA